MAKLLVLYNPPTDPEAFDAHYATRHIPLVRMVPGLRRFDVSTGEVMTEGHARYHKIVTLAFDSVAEVQTGLASPEGEAAVADLANFASGGATILIFEEQTV